MAAPILIPRPDPLTVLVPVWGVFWGVIGAATFAISRPATTGGIPPVGVYVFFVTLALMSSAVLVGMAMRSVRGVRLRIGANIALGSLCACYSVWAVQALGIVRPFAIVSLLLTICVASFWDARRLNVALSPKE